MNSTLISNRASRQPRLAIPKNAYRAVNTANCLQPYEHEIPFCDPPGCATFVMSISTVSTSLERLQDQEYKTTSLLALLSNPLILLETLQWLPVFSVLDLGATSKSYRNLIYETPHVFRSLDLSPFKIAQCEVTQIDHGGETWRNVQLDENLTEDE